MADKICYQREWRTIDLSTADAKHVSGGLVEAEGFTPDLPPILTGHHTPAVQKNVESRYTPHSLRATAATLGLDAGIPIEKIQEMLGHRHITTTRIYDCSPSPITTSVNSGVFFS